MGKRQRDCVSCGAPVGIIGRAHCCACMVRIRQADAKVHCPSCGKDRVLVAETGRCVLCSRRCAVCGGPVRAKDATQCRGCERRADREAAKALCPRCGKPGFLREHTGWCGPCSRPAPPKNPPRTCAICGELRRHAALGMCGRCWQRQPHRPFVQSERLISSLEQPPAWLREFVAYLAARYCAGRACPMITALGRLLADEHSNQPQALLERARLPGRSVGTLAKTLENFFLDSGLALASNEQDRRAAGRRGRRIDAVPAPLRPAVEAFCATMLRKRERARRAGTKPRSDSTTESALATVRDLAQYLDTERGKQDWALVDVHDVEAFLATAPNYRTRRLAPLRQFFQVAKARRLVLVDPTRGLTAPNRRGYRGQTLTLEQQRGLFRRWTTDPAAHPHEGLVGMLALIHGASRQEARFLRCDDVDGLERTVRLGRRTHPVPLDPATWTVLQRCLEFRQQQQTQNPHVIVTRITRSGRAAVSAWYFGQLLAPAGVATRTLRGTRLVDLVNTMDPKLVSAAFGMRPEGVLNYLADRIDPTLEANM